MIVKKLLCLMAVVPTIVSAADNDFVADKKESGEIVPKSYVCHKTETPVTIDGQIYDKEWDTAPWSDYFVDIEGEKRDLKPRFDTRVKMLWDDTYLYIAAELKEPDIWGYLTERESVIYFDNDFEVFVDPDGDGLHYMEYEINALGTDWDLMLTKQYNKGGRAIDCWSINGLKKTVKTYGSLNDGRDEDDKWCVEIAIPLDALTEAGGKTGVGKCWRINFSRVEWETKWDGEKYVKIPNRYTGKEGVGGEDNWVWSPQGVINMHEPSMWGFLHFAGAAEASKK